MEINAKNFKKALHSFSLWLSYSSFSTYFSMQEWDYASSEHMQFRISEQICILKAILDKHFCQSLQNNLRFFQIIKKR